MASNVSIRTISPRVSAPLPATAKSLWLCSSVYCGPPHQFRCIMVAGRSRQPKTYISGYHLAQATKLTAKAVGKHWWSRLRNITFCVGHKLEISTRTLCFDRRRPILASQWSCTNALSQSHVTVHYDTTVDGSQLSGNGSDSGHVLSSIDKNCKYTHEAVSYKTFTNLLKTVPRNDEGKILAEEVCLYDIEIKSSKLHCYHNFVLNLIVLQGFPLYDRCKENVYTSMSKFQILILWLVIWCGYL